MKPKRVILCPNPYRDSELKVCKQSRDMLESLGMQTSVCLPFQREGYGEELGIPMRLLQQEIRSADLLIAFGGDGTILHLARTVALHSVTFGHYTGHLYDEETEPHFYQRISAIFSREKKKKTGSDPCRRANGYLHRIDDCLYDDTYATFNHRRAG